MAAQQRSVLLLATASVLVLCAGVALAAKTAPLTKPPCNIMGYPGGPLWKDADATCIEFNPAPEPPISMPNDTATTKYGQIVITTQNGSSTVGAVFVDRTGKAYNISAAADPPSDETELRTIWPHLIVEANFTSGSSVVAAYGAALYVPFRAVLGAFASTQFEGVITNSDPVPSGVSNTSLVRWSISENSIIIDPTKKNLSTINGTFDNLFRSVKDSNGTCRPALCSDAASTSAVCQYYTKSFGKTTSNLTLNWDPDMTSATDSELVITTVGSGNKWSAPFVQLWQLLQPFKFWPGRSWTFTATFNGTASSGIPLNITGSFVNATGVNVTFC